MTRADAPAYRDPVRFHAARTPGKLALLDLASGRRITYADLDRRADGLAAHLRACGVAPGDRIAILSRNGPAFFELQFAASRLGVAIAPLNLRLALDELGFILGDCKPAMLVYDTAFADTAAALAERLPGMQRLALDLDDPDCPFERAAAGPPSGEPDHPATHDDVCLIIYTSGTTGRPKGALITHGVIFWQSVNCTGPCRLTASTVELVMLPLFHIAGMNANANPTLRLGGSVLIQRSFDAGETLRLLSDAALGVSCLTGVTAQYQFMAAHADFEAADLSRLTYAGVGGSPTPAPLLKVYADRGVPLCEGFGMTEAGPGVCTLGTADLARKRGSVGKPLMHVDIRLVADGADVAEGEIGELWLRAPNIVPGYWRHPEANAAAFVDGWFRTGDLARRDDEGFLYIVDRLKDMYISGGENVYPAEVERVLYLLPEVAEAAVIGVPDARWGETGHAFLVVRPDATLSEAEVLRHCEDRLAKFKRPAGVSFVAELPRNASGKVLKRQLRATA
jgi:fatty-acyl-CoA synthase